ncbi:pyrroline-5-carboxylate reductase [Caldanaerovirga acetigignens]|uniref:Pyrroline-5-carboxylate reductase n=1 Tax=Caldanaerovirga acetigignens TaxID=447595 RepID=A0A1M7GTK5_9FIRM|nr:pyrroline-5-carboxylate reductase [Caldanaerovirga acetigignens]
MGKVGFFGAGSMAEALLKGLLGAGVFRAEDIIVINKQNDQRLEYIRKTYDVKVTRDYSEIAGECSILMLLVKPKDVGEVMERIKSHLNERHLIISVAAGITTSFIESFYSKELKVIRAMPNISCQVKESATAIAAGRYAGGRDLKKASEIFSSVGKVYFVDEKWLDAVTALSGSGPAYVYLMMEALTEAGVRAGLPEKVSYELAVQTVFGAAKMVVETGEEPLTLRKKVTSPGGTTMAGIETLEKMGFVNAIVQAVKSAARRSVEMRKESGVSGNS